MVENQNPLDGSMPKMVPPVLGKNRDLTSPNWSTAYPMVLWNMLTHYGDRQLITNHHDPLVRYFDFLESSYQKGGGLKNFPCDCCYGDWGKSFYSQDSSGIVHVCVAFCSFNRVFLKLSSAPEGATQSRSAFHGCLCTLG